MRKASFNTHTDVSSGASGVYVGPSLHLHPNFVYASIRESGVPQQSRIS